MTKEEILKLEQGLELDCLIAEKILGYYWGSAGHKELRFLAAPGDYDKHRHPFWPIEKTEDMSLTIASDERDRIPKFSKEIQWAWKVVDHLSSLGIQIYLEDFRRKGEFIRPGWWILYTLSDGHDTGHIVTQSVEEGICKAALYAMSMYRPGANSVMVALGNLDPSV